MAYKIVNMWTPSSKYGIKAPYTMKPTTITWHETANNATARNEVSYMNSNNMYVSYHVAVDDKEIVQAIPFNRSAWAAGDGANGAGNRTSIHLEICYNKDNGFRGAISPRMEKAIDNAVTYTAHVLHQYGWGVDRMRQHYDWSRKDCPMKIRATGRWNEIKRRVNAELQALKKGEAKPAKPVSKPAKKAAPKKTSTTAKWTTNKHGTQYLKTSGTWVNGNQPIMTRFHSPFQSAKQGGWAKAGYKVNYTGMCRQDGHIWLEYTLDKGKTYKYIPVKTWNSKTGAVGKDWGGFK